MIAAVAAGHGLVFWPVLHRAIFNPETWAGPNDFPTHLSFIPRVFERPWRPGPAHFLFHALSRGVGLPWDDPRVGALIVVVAGAAAAGALWFAALHQATSETGWGAGAAFAVSLLLVLTEAPAAVTGWDLFSRGHTFFPLHVYSNPTGLVLTPLATVLLWCALHIGHSGIPLSPRVRLLVVMIAICAPLAKPSFSMSLIAAWPLWVWLRHRAEADRSAIRPLLRRFALLIAVPSAGVIVLQYLILRYQLPAQHRTGFTVAPFSALSDFDGLTPVFWLVFAFPVAALALYGHALWEDSAVQLSGLCTLTGIAFLVTFRETGFAGDLAINFFWPAQISLVLLCLAIARRLVLILPRGHVVDWRLLVVLAVWAPYVAAGARFWIDHV